MKVRDTIFKRLMGIELLLCTFFSFRRRAAKAALPSVVATTTSQGDFSKGKQTKSNRAVDEILYVGNGAQPDRIVKYYQHQPNYGGRLTLPRHSEQPGDLECRFLLAPFLRYPP